MMSPRISRSMALLDGTSFDQTHCKTDLPNRMILRFSIGDKSAGDQNRPRKANLVVGYTTPNGGLDGWVSLAVHVMGAEIPDVLQPDALLWIEKAHRPVVKVLPESGQLPMRQLAPRVRVV
ncbi:hypothetical protein TNCV_3102591 [Trichonephila clavipes]|nr:hypothetical protein TNCV_3102591 [Trichonephila clavipes]